MKIVRTAIVLILVLLGCVSCAPEQKNGKDSFAPGAITEKPAIKMKKATESTGTCTVTEYDESGNEIRGVHYNENSEIVFSYSCDYDENGNLLGRTRTDAEGNVSSVTKNIYDKDGNLLENYRGDNGDELILNEKYTYDDGKLISSVDYGFSGDYISGYEYEYDSKGLLIKRLKTAESGSVIRVYEYEYDENDALIKMSDTMYNKTTIYFYDSEGRSIREERYLEDGSLSFMIIDRYGKYGLEEDVMYDGDGREKRHIRNVYKNKGKNVIQYRIDENGSKTKCGLKKYDDNGNLLYSVSDGNGFGGSEYMAEYNEFGDPVRIHVVNNDSTKDIGPYDITTEYEYQYY